MGSRKINGDRYRRGETPSRKFSTGWSIDGWRLKQSHAKTCGQAQERAENDLRASLDAMISEEKTTEEQCRRLVDSFNAWWKSDAGTGVNLKTGEAIPRWFQPFVDDGTIMLETKGTLRACGPVGAGNGLFLDLPGVPVGGSPSPRQRPH